MKYLLALLLSVFFWSSYAQTIIKDENVELREVSPFSGFKVTDGMDIYFSQSDQTALAVSAGDIKTREHIKTEVIDNILVISFRGGSLSFMDQKKMRVYISSPKIESIEASGASNINIQQVLNAEALRLDLSGACEITGKINVDDMDMLLSGASTSKLEGTVGNLKLKASGASDMKNYQLAVQNLIADISGASDVKVMVNKSIKVQASGASNFIYSGLPEIVNTQSTGASSIKQRKF